MADTEQQVTPAPAQAAQQTLIAEYDIDPTPEPAGAAPDSVRSPEPAPNPGAEPTPRGADGRFLPHDAAPAPQHSQSLMAMARDFGITDEEMSTVTPDALQVAVYQLMQRDRRQQKESAAAQTIHQATDRNLGNQPPAEPEPPPVDESMYDPGLMRMLKQMRDDHAQQIKALKDQISQLQQVEAVRSNESFADKMDRLFSGDEKTFGKGDRHSLKEGSADLARRRAVLFQMQQITQGTLEAKYQQAYKLLYGEREPAPEPELAARQQEWLRGNVARPTNRDNAAEPDGVAKATRSVAAKQREMNGAPTGQSGSVAPDDFPE